MKKIFILFISVLTVIGCGDNIEFNDPAMQGRRNGNYWKANYFSSDIDFGGFLIEGGGNSGTLQLVTSNDRSGTYDLGGERASVAIFKDENGIVYSTANAPDPSVSVYPTDGQIIIEDVVGETVPKTLIGTFWFNAYTADGLNYINFNEGVFYKVPLLGGLVVIDNGSVCLQAAQQTVIARNAYNATDMSMPDYTDICNAYKQALNNHIIACGDSSGSFQAIVDSLGDCIP